MNFLGMSRSARIPACGHRTFTTRQFTFAAIVWQCTDGPVILWTAGFGCDSMRPYRDKCRIWLVLAGGFLLWTATARSWAAQSDTQPSDGAVYLDLGTRPAYPVQTGLIAWEIFRQSVLLAARDDLG